MKNRSVSFPDEINDILNKEAERQGTSFNKVVVSAVSEKYDPSSYDEETADRSDGGIREVENADSSYKEIKLRLSVDDINRLKQFASEARLSVTELIRRFARYGKVESNEVKLIGIDRFNEAVVPFLGDLQFMLKNEELLPEAQELADKLFDEMAKLKRDMYNTQRRVKNSINKERK